MNRLLARLIGRSVHARSDLIHFFDQPGPKGSALCESNVYVCILLTKPALKHDVVVMRVESDKISYCLKYYDGDTFDRFADHLVVEIRRHLEY